MATATAIPVGKVAASAQTAPSSAGGIEFGRHPISIGACPYCNQPSTTRIKTYPSWETWVAAGILVLVFWPLCWVPLVTDTVRYYCVLYDFNQTLCTPIDIMYTHNCNYTFPAGSTVAWAGLYWGGMYNSSNAGITNQELQATRGKFYHNDIMSYEH